MRRLAKNLILATAVVSAIFIVDLSCAEAITQEKICPYQNSMRCLDFWSKFRDTVMPDPDEPQNNNPPKEIDGEEPEPVKKPAPKPVERPKPKPVEKYSG